MVLHQKKFPVEVRKVELWPIFAQYKALFALNVPALWTTQTAGLVTHTVFPQSGERWPILACIQRPSDDITNQNISRSQVFCCPCHKSCEMSSN